MLLSRKDACLLLVDVQEKLFPLIHQHQILEKHCQWLLSLASALDIPIVVSEQYPRGLGHTIPSLQALINNSTTLAKVHFSCAEDNGCVQALQNLNKKQIIVIGIETHVCVLQTVLGLMAKHYDVFVVADAVGARHNYDHEMGIQRMRANGAHIVTKEMMFFECLGQAGTEQFKSLSQQYFPRGES